MIFKFSLYLDALGLIDEYLDVNWEFSITQS